MSHVVDMDLEVQDLDSLKKCAKDLGLEFVENQKKFKWYGTHVGDYPLPKGFSKQDMGKCDHAIRIPGQPNAYEIGVCKAKDGSKGYKLLWDFWMGGYGLQEKIGKEGGLLKQSYAIQRAKKEALRQGKRVEIKRRQNGEIWLKAMN